jgi:para-aminobenzoate synthetase component 1
MDTRELSYASDPQCVFPRLLEMPRPALLHSADRGHPDARYDIMVADPECIIEWTPGCPEDPLTKIAAAMPGCDEHSPPHFRTGFLGYFGYPLHTVLDRHTAPPPDPTNIPAVAGGIYRWSVVTDHARRCTNLHMDPALSPSHRDTLYRRLSSSSTKHTAQMLTPGTFVAGTFVAELDSAGYREAYRQVQRYIRDGESYQINLAQHYAAPYTLPGPTGSTRNLGPASWNVYRRLLALQPGAFSAYLLGPAGAVLSFSPERFLRFADRHLQTRPIKGTRPRGHNARRDAELRAELESSPKERAENLMIVDLMRNDLGRVCEPGSIHVARLFEVESMRNVHHLVSTIEGVARADVGAFDVLRAVFPGGSITGAPKFRAIDIINQLEPVGRSVFCGCIGYIDASGRMDTNIAIRTLVIDAERVHCWGGGGIVADSQEHLELAEIDYKIGALLQGLECASSRKSWSAA